MKLLPVAALLAYTAFAVARVAQIDTALLQRFELFSQYALASYCPHNDNASSRTITCASGGCPLVERARPMNVMGLAESPNYDVNGFIAHDDYNRATVISFRGSLSLKNWQADLDLKAVDARVCKGCTATRGFWRSWDEARIPVLAAINTTSRGFPNHRIVTTGHSLGGAIATLAATELRHMGLTVDLYTYGSPRVGNAVLARMIESQAPKFGQNYRITHYNDPVPALPPMSLGFSHVRPEYYISSKNKEPVRPSDVQVFDEIDSVKGNAQFYLSDASAHSWYLGAVSDCDAKGNNAGSMGALQQMGMFNQNQEQKAKGPQPVPASAPPASFIPSWTGPPRAASGTSPLAPLPPSQPAPVQPASGGILDSIGSVFGGSKKNETQERKSKGILQRPKPSTLEDWQLQALEQLDTFKAGAPQPWFGIPGLSTPASWNPLQPSIPRPSAPQGKPQTVSPSWNYPSAAQSKPPPAPQPKPPAGSPPQAASSQPGLFGLPLFGSSQPQQAPAPVAQAVQPKPAGAAPFQAAPAQPGYTFNVPFFGSSQPQPAPAPPSSGFPFSVPSFGSSQSPPAKPQQAPPQSVQPKPASWWSSRVREADGAENSEAPESQQTQDPNTRLASLQRRYALHVFKAVTEAQGA